MHCLHTANQIPAYSSKDKMILCSFTMFSFVIVHTHLSSTLIHGRNRRIRQSILMHMTLPTSQHRIHLLKPPQIHRRI
jgi:hypothetical protein